MSRSDPQVNFRMPAELKAKLESAAKASNRSITAEVVARLQDSFAEKAPDSAIKAKLAVLEMKAMMTEATLSASMAQLLQRIPTSSDDEAKAVNSLTQQLLDRVKGLGDLQQRFNELVAKLPTD